jgi:hypothetical protein
MLTRDLLKKIRKIEIVTERLVRDRMAGQYHSVFKGSGIAFSEVRQYMPGDDIRLIDWNVSARMNDTYVKLFTEEREMTVLLLVDMSASGRFGSRVQEKRELAAEIAAVLAFSAIRNNDRVGLVIFTDEVEHFVPPKKGKKHVLRVISEILSFEPRSPRTNIAGALQFVGRIARRRAVTFLISDFLAPTETYERALRITSRRHSGSPTWGSWSWPTPRPARWSSSTRADPRAGPSPRPRSAPSPIESHSSGDSTWMPSASARRSLTCRRSRRSSRPAPGGCGIEAARDRDRARVRRGVGRGARDGGRHGA